MLEGPILLPIKEEPRFDRRSSWANEDPHYSLAHSPCLQSQEGTGSRDYPGGGQELGRRLIVWALGRKSDGPSLTGDGGQGLGMAGE